MPSSTVLDNAFWRTPADGVAFSFSLSERFPDTVEGNLTESRHRHGWSDGGYQPAHHQSPPPR